jgi:hypothetical protein
VNWNLQSKHPQFYLVRRSYDNERRSGAHRECFEEGFIGRRRDYEIQRLAFRSVRRMHQLRVVFDEFWSRQLTLKLPT